MLTYNDIGKGETIVFIHGLGMTKEYWKYQIALSTKYRIIAVDLRGHGETEEETDISMENFAKDIIELIELLHIKETYICGHSLGGLVAQELYNQRPDLVKGLILANTTSYITPLANIIMRNTNITNKEYFIDKIARRAIHNLDSLEDVKNAFLIRDCYIECAKAPVGVYYTGILKNIDVPVLLIASDCDFVTPIYEMHTMSYVLKDCEFVILNNTGHMSNMEMPEKFNDCVDNFIESKI